MRPDSRRTAHPTPRISEQPTREEALLELCRSTAARALLVGSLSGCGHGAVVATAGPTEMPEPTASVLREEQTSPEHASEGPFEFELPAFVEREANRAVYEDPGVAPPILPSDTPNLVSSKQYAGFPCGGVLHPHLGESDVPTREGRDAYQRSLLNTPVRGLHVARKAEYVEILQAHVVPSYFDGRRVPQVEIERFSEAGTPCSTASDRPRCLEKLNTQRVRMAASFVCDDNKCKGTATTYALLTQGDEVTLLRTPSEFKAWLGPIDTPVEAWLMLMARRLVEGLRCGDPEGAKHRITTNGFEITGRKVASFCVQGESPYTEVEVVYTVDRTGAVRLVRSRVALTRHRCVASGRRPPGLIPTLSQGDATRSAGALFARMAELEHASIAAFRRLGRELTALGAGAELRARIRGATRDEIAHTRALTELALAHGVTPKRPVIVNSQARGAFALALDNIREGAVRELFGALSLHVQKERAQSAEVREVFASLAKDEARHAALAFEIHDFLWPLLREQERIQVDAARQGAVRELEDELDEPSAEERLLCGLPTLREARVLLEGLAG